MFLLVSFVLVLVSLYVTLPRELGHFLINFLTFLLYFLYCNLYFESIVKKFTPFLRSPTFFFFLTKSE
jgi:hypothetical protein